jgi:hypothetical protein
VSAAQSTHGGPFAEGLPRRKDAHPEDCAGCAAAEHSCRSRKVLDALAGKPADATLPAGTAPRCAHPGKTCAEMVCSGDLSPTKSGNGRPMTLEDSAKAAALVSHMAVAGRLGPNDLRVLTWIAERLPFETLLGACTAIKDQAREPAGTPNNYRPTPREHVALGSLLDVVRQVRRLILPHEDECPCRPCVERRAPR